MLLRLRKQNQSTRASETLFVGQPTLSRAIKELEQNLGIKIFDRSAKGMFLTPDGEVFIRYAKAILKQVDEVEAAFRRSGTRRQRFSAFMPPCKLYFRCIHGILTAV